MKTCVFIIGTNGVGKSSTARAIMQAHGGLKKVGYQLSICSDNKVCFAGRYVDGSAYGGVDSLCGTAGLEDVVRRGLTEHEYIICEGSYMDTFGINLQRAIFSAPRQLVVLLFAPYDIINARLKERSKSTAIKGAMKRQTRCINSTKKWAGIGVPTMCIDTSANTPSEIAKMIEHRLI